MADPRNPEQNDQSDQNRGPDQRTQLGQHQDKQAHQEQNPDKRHQERNPDKQGQQTAKPGRDRYASGQQDDEDTDAGNEKTSERRAGENLTDQPDQKQSQE